MIPYSLASLFARLQMPDQRAAGLRDLAALVGARALLLFGADTEVGRYLPAPGLPQTLRDGHLWHGFLQECARDGTAHARMPDPDAGADTPAYGMTDGDGHAIIVFLGARPAAPLELPLRALLPLLGPQLAAERRALALEGQAVAAGDRLRHALALTAALDERARALQQALDAALRRTS